MKRPALQTLATRPAAFLVGAVLLATVAFFDWLTGPKLDFSLFYLVPICYVTWNAGAAWGYAMTAVAAAVWFGASELTGALRWFGPIVPWNVLMRLAFFSGTVFLLSGWKRSSRHLALLVERRTRTLRQVTAELLASEEAERRKLASDMHDAFSQTLSLIKMNLDAAKLEAGLPPQVLGRLTDCASMVESVTRQARTLMFDLYPAILDDLGLVPTLQWYARQLQERGEADLVVSERGLRQRLHSDVRNYVFRSAKELLNNALRHGRPREVNLLVQWEPEWQPERLRLVVDDDGRGFDPQVMIGLARSGLGLASIRDRLASLGGRLDIESSPGHGTRVILELPLRGATATGIATAAPTTATTGTVAADSTMTTTPTTRERSDHAVARAAG